MQQLRILVLCRPFLGDQVLSGPVFRNLRAWRPQARIVAACYAEWLEPLSLFPEIDEALAIPRGRMGTRTGAVRQWVAFVRKLHRERFDIVYDLMQADRISLRASVVTWMTRSPVRLSFTERHPKLRHRVYTHLVEWADLEDMHTTDRYLTGLTMLGVPIRTRSIAIGVHHGEREAARARLAQLLPARRRPLVMVHPGAGSHEKRWPVARFAAIINELQLRAGVQVLVIGGPREGMLLQDLRAAVHADVAFVDEVLSIRALAAMLHEADLFIGNDSGPMHLAAAVGTPVVALFGASSTARWGPLGSARHTVVRPNKPCEHCPHANLCTPPDPSRMLCVHRIDTEEVWHAVHARLAARRAEERIAADVQRPLRRNAG